MAAARVGPPCIPGNTFHHADGCSPAVYNELDRLREVGSARLVSPGRFWLPEAAGGLDRQPLLGTKCKRPVTARPSCVTRQGARRHRVRSGPTFTSASSAMSAQSGAESTVESPGRHWRPRGVCADRRTEFWGAPRVIRACRGRWVNGWRTSMPAVAASALASLRRASKPGAKAIP